MDISRLNPLNFLGLSKKTDKVEKPGASNHQVFKQDSLEAVVQSGNDSVSISFESLVKKTQVEARQEMDKVREDKVKEIKERIDAGQYNVSADDIAAAILDGRAGIYEELK